MRLTCIWAWFCSVWCSLLQLSRTCKNRSLNKSWKVRELKYILLLKLAPYIAYNVYEGKCILHIFIFTVILGFKKLIPKECTVWRNGAIDKIDAGLIVRGDIVELHEGDQVPADLQIIKATEFKVDNSSLTGESEAQDRSNNPGGASITTAFEAENLCFFTTIAVTGTCTGIVVGIADGTAMGQIAGLATETTNDETPISKEIKKFIHLISAVAITLGVVFFIIGVVLGTEIIKNVVFMIGIIVANVPEGLLATVTVSLALTAKRMHKKNVLVKNLEAVETLGSTTIIASDKTGTLTQNRMTVQHCWYDLKTFRTPAGKNTVDFKRILASPVPGGEENYDPNSATFKKLQMIATLCNNSVLIKDEDSDSRSIPELMNDPTFNLLGLKATGDASEQGLMKAMQPLRDVQNYRDGCPKVAEIKFNSTNKWQLSIHAMEDPEAPLTLVLKGAPERVLDRCQSILIDGQITKLTPKLTEEYTRAYEELGGLGERVLGFAYSELDKNVYKKGFNFVTKPPNFPNDDLIFVGLLSLIDPPREGVPEAVAKCKRARIKVFMVTGDHPITAQAIAKQVGIIDQQAYDDGDAAVIKGDDIRDWEAIENPADRQAKWDQALSHHQIVFARVSPAHKLQIVENNQRRLEVVAVTGDGVNDAPALKKGDIGVAMGIAGKDVSKEAADMILMDDNFASIVNGVEEGRLIFDNLKKSICYTLTSNIPEIGPFLIFITVRLPLPMTTVLILCVDLGTDMVPAISLAYEEKESDIMDRAPRNSATDRLVNRRLISFAYLQIGVMQALAGFFTYMVVLNDYGFAPHTLPGVGLEWEETSIMCTTTEDGFPDDCGYGCEDPDEFVYGDLKYEYCVGGCKIPFTSVDSNISDPFLEFSVNTEGKSMGFRGYDGPIHPCKRTCETLEQELGSLSVMERNGYDMYCGPDVPVDMKKMWNEGRDTAAMNSGSEAPEGAFYWWAGRQQYFPNKDYQTEALAYAQTSYFISIIVVQWADLLIAKTRKLSIFDQGMTNGFMIFGIAFETLLGCFLIYVPVFNMVFGTRPLHILHWFPGVPWSILIFLYDETRKYYMRQYPGGWLDRFTYW